MTHTPVAVGDFVRLGYAGLGAGDLVREGVGVLEGVSAEAERVLAGLGIVTVFDLGASWLFRNARVAVGGVSGGSVVSGGFPGDVLVAGAVEAGGGGVAGLPLGALRGIDAGMAAALRAGLGVESIGDLARWPAYVVARSLVGGVSGAVAPVVDGGESFQPRFGQYPTERVYYGTLVMLHMEPGAPPARVLDGPVSLDAVVDQVAGPRRVAVGATLTYSQSWYAQGITLGHLLHSLALAPGEATRIAVVDWSRRSRSTDVEAVTQQERLDDASTHARALSEVQDAVAKDLQQGGSRTHSDSTTESQSTSGAAGTGLVESLWGSADVSMTSQSGRTNADASSSSWSLGNRSINADMSQNINDRTEQHSNSVRNRRASAVSEISQSEHSEASTRVVANYNHMHALAVQYYEIVQTYRIATELRHAERCLFVPVETIDFQRPESERLIDRFRGALARSALGGRARELLFDPQPAVAIIPEVPLRIPTAREFAVAMAKNTRGFKRTARKTARDHEHPEHVANGHPDEHHEPYHDGHPAPPQEHLRVSMDVSAHHPSILHGWWDLDEVTHVSRLLNRPAFRRGSNAMHLPGDTELIGVSFTGVAVSNVTVHGTGHRVENLHAVAEHAAELELPTPRPIAELDGISITNRDNHPAHGMIRLICSHLGRQFTLPPIPISLLAGHAAQQAVRFSSDAADRTRELRAHLQHNRGYYSQIIHRALDPSAVLAILSQYTWNGRPLTEQVEPQPVAVSGGYLILRAPIEAHESSGVIEDGRHLSWSELLQARGLTFGPHDERIVPIPTSGVHAEAVLGASNAAEKLDITRFWNWQDSPIPLTPTDIAPPSTATRATAETAKPGGLEPSVLHLATPTALPTPDSLGAVLGALANANMFRDMSGLAGTQALATTAMTQATTAADTAGQLASANMRTEAQKSVAMAQTAADLIKSLAGAGSGGGTSASTKPPSTVSEKGAYINQGTNLDNKGIPFPTKQTPGQPTPATTWQGETTSQTLTGLSPGMLTNVLDSSGRKVVTPPPWPPQPCGTESRPPNHPDRFLEFRGEVEHAVVQIDFMSHPGRRAEWSVPGAAKKGNGRTGFVDAIDLGTHEVYEIKPEHLAAMAVSEAAWYTEAANMACPPRGQWVPGKSYEPSRNPLFTGPGMKLFARQGDPGAILYRWEFDEDLLKAFSLSFLIGLAAKHVRDEIFGKSSKVDPTKVPALAFAPLVVKLVAPSLRTQFPNAAAALTKQLEQQTGWVPVGTAVAITLPQEIFVATVGQALLIDKLRNMQVQTDPNLELARMLTLALSAAGASFGLPFALWLGTKGVVIGVQALAAALPAAVPEALGDVGSAVLRFLSSASTAAPGGLVFGLMRTAKADEIEMHLPVSFKKLADGPTFSLGDEITTDAASQFVVGAAEA